MQPFQINEGADTTLSAIRSGCGPSWRGWTPGMGCAPTR
ncbi:hypothetical protein SPMU_23030 [Sphingomonas mucosissima]|uniref:Uncharacterized protein n=1 Tax=Sphingomonas mucosissima TaxID=370959 RepID=A0A245ZJF8_9SPHN|nr:hypothetical protein SPMU_23030 [Sphingomonas mucosissima]